MASPMVRTEPEVAFLTRTLQTESGTEPIEAEDDNCARVVLDFIDAVKAGRQPVASGPSVLPAMEVLQAVQDAWDRRYGAQPIPGRLVP